MGTSSEGYTAWSLYVLIAAVLVLGLFVLLRRFLHANERQAKREADERIASILANALAERLTVSRDEMERTLQAPTSNLPLWERANNAVGGCDITFERLDGTTVRVTVNVTWHDGRTLRAEQSWNWEAVPAEVREKLLRSGHPVSVPWQLSAAA